ncbi:MAG TPA: O-methyltransferase [Ktedonobacterales bacterium]|nr:O-methyltransferase [Ktedonobacterales bacterium]
MANDQEQARAFIDQRLIDLFAPEDEALRAAREATQANDMPAIEISPLQGRLLQVLARLCNARSILEIGALAGYSGIWLARALPADGRFISLEVSEKHAQVARASLARAGIAAHTEVRVGPGAELLPALVAEAPFDLIFIDADKPGYLTYLDWALKLARPGSVIVADNCIRSGPPLAENYAAGDDTVRTVGEYDRRVASDPRLLSVALPIDEGGMDGFAISVVLGS